MNAGFAGGLNPALAVGDVVLVDGFAGGSPGEHSVLEEARLFAASQGLRPATLVTVDAPVLDGEESAALWRRTAADVVDMEGAHIWSLARRANLPFAGFKVVSDRADAGARVEVRRRQGDLAERLGSAVAPFLAGFVAEIHGYHCHNPGL